MYPGDESGSGVAGPAAGNFPAHDVRDTRSPRENEMAPQQSAPQPRVRHHPGPFPI